LDDDLGGDLERGLVDEAGLEEDLSSGGDLGGGLLDEHGFERDLVREGCSETEILDAYVSKYISIYAKKMVLSTSFFSSIKKENYY
jgi:hypothetical protein